MLTHEAIREVAVLGVDDDVYGEVVAAIVVVEDGTSAEELSVDELRLWCRERLASYKAPSIVRTVDAIERNAMGKINKKLLKATLFPVCNS